MRRRGDQCGDRTAPDRDREQGATLVCPVDGRRIDDEAAERRAVGSAGEDGDRSAGERHAHDAYAVIDEVDARGVDGDGIGARLVRGERRRRPAAHRRAHHGAGPSPVADHRPVHMRVAGRDAHRAVLACRHRDRDGLAHACRARSAAAAVAAAAAVVGVDARVGAAGGARDEPAVAARRVGGGYVRRAEGVRQRRVRVTRRPVVRRVRGGSVGGRSVIPGPRSQKLGARPAARPAQHGAEGAPEQGANSRDKCSIRV